MKIDCKIVATREDDYCDLERWEITVDGELVGSAVVQNFFSKEDDGVYISRLDIYDEYQNHGYGTELLKTISNYYRNCLDCGLCNVYICPDNEDARRLYERLGEKAENYPECYGYLDCGLGVYDMTWCG